MWLATTPIFRRSRSARSFAPLGAGRIEASNAPGFAVGDIVFGMTGWQDYVAMNPKGQLNKLPPGAPLELAMSVLGINGVTAYFGLLDVGSPVAGRNRRRLRRGGRDRLGRRPDREDQGLPRDRHRGRGREMPLADRRTRLRRGDRLQVGGRPGAPEGAVPRRASTSISTTSAATSSTRRWRGSRCGGGWCSAARSRHTTRPSRRRDRRTTST